MMSRFFHELSRDEAYSYRDEYRAQHTSKLDELRRLLHENGGRKVELDGSARSLVPLWVWAKSYMDAELSGIPSGARTLARQYQAPDEVSGAPVRYLGELLEHYVFEIAQQLWPASSLETYVQSSTKIIDEQHHQVGIAVPGHGMFHVSGRLGTFASSYLKGREFTSADDALEQLIRETLPIPPGPGDHALTLIDDVPPTVAPNGPADAEAAGGTHNALGIEGILGESELIFAAVGANPEELEIAPPLDEGPIAALLSGYGYVDESGSPVDKSSLQHDGVTDLGSERTAIAVTSLAAGEKLRSLFLEILDPADEHARALLKELSILGQSTGSRLASEDSMH